MKAMILAAGKGTRVRPLTNVLPKPMIPLIRKPIMEAIIDHLHRHAFDEIYINTSYLSHAIEDYFRDGDRFGVSIAYSYEGKLVDGEFLDQPLGSAGGMRRIQDHCGFFDDTFAVLCGDALIDVDLTEVLRFHRASGAIATIVTKPVPREEVSKYGVVVTDTQGRVLRFQEKPKVAEAASNTINTGIYLFEPRVFDHIPAGTEYDIGSQLFPRLIAAGEKVCAISLPFEWVDIGCVHDFWNATRLILEGRVQGLKVPGREIRPGVFAGLGVTIAADATIQGPVYLGSGTRIGAGVHIEGPAMIGANCVLQAGVRIRGGILGDYTRVTEGALLDERIVFAGKFIEPSGQAVDLVDTDMRWVLGDARTPSAEHPAHADLRTAMYEAALAAG
ncbi:NDP-sugar synthase [Sphaerotilus sp.]|jgi:mannose-1-phosphate guanylyltransferase|uniref:NDP-sugar synthase n=1 Tax=Sphaerotilus sp. TaxID=2093942 RepID=UPI0025CFA0E9|nr:NDP-sugar synthase [Sphaerotilus sp.]